MLKDQTPGNVLVYSTILFTFHVDLTGDEPTWSCPVNGGPGLVNPGGAVVFVYVMDKGPLAPPGLLREAQTRTLYGGCQGPPAFGPLPCTGVGLAQHLPPEPIGAARR